MSYVLALLFFTADFTAPEETLKAGADGYRHRAEAVRKQAIAEAERQVRELNASLLAAKRGKLSPSLVGTKDASGLIVGGTFFFGTETDKAQQVMSLSRESQERQDVLVGLKSKKILPQVALRLDGATLGATGVIRWGFARVSRTIDRESFRMNANGHRITGEPSIERAEDSETEFIIEHGGTAVPMENGRVAIAGVYQFVGTSRGLAVLRLTKDLPVSDMECVFSDNGTLLPLLRH